MSKAKSEDLQITHDYRGTISHHTCLENRKLFPMRIEKGIIFKDA